MAAVKKLSSVSLDHGATACTNGAMSERRTMHADSLRSATDMVETRSEADLDRASRCEGWSVRDLIEHMVGQNYGFAEAIAKGCSGFTAYDPQPVGRWGDSAAALTSAIARPAESVTLIEISPDTAFPLDSVLAIHTLDLAVHTWDALGDAFRPSDDIVGLVLAVAGRTTSSAGTSTAFAPPVQSSDSPDQWERALNLLGRSTSP